MLKITLRQAPKFSNIYRPSFTQLRTFASIKPTVQPALGIYVDVVHKPGSADPEALVLKEVHPLPIRSEFLVGRKLKSSDLEHLDIRVGYHREPKDFSDKLALFMVKFLRVPMDIFFKTKYVHRAVMLETIAAVPGMVAGMCRHLSSLRKMQHDGGWITHVLNEAENERMHLLTWIKVINPSPFDRFLVMGAQGVFFNVYFLAYLLAPKACHRFVGYLEEEAVVSYTAFLKEIDAGRIENTPAPKIAIDYWHLDDNALLRDVVLSVRADEAAHRDVNHILSDRIKQKNVDLRNPMKSA